MWTLLVVRLGLAQDVLVPSFTPRTTVDFAIASLLTDEIVSSLRRAGLDAQGGHVVDARLPEATAGCAEDAACPAQLFRTFPARLALVGQVGNTSAGGLEVVIRYYGSQDSSPIEVLTNTVAGGTEDAFADSVAAVAQEILGLLPPRVEDPGIIDLPIVEPTEDPPTGGGEVLDPWSQGASAQPRKPNTPRASARYAQDLDSSDEVERRAMGSIPRWAYERYKASGMDRAAWTEEERLRAGLVSLEVYGGAALGDVDRRYDVRLTGEGQGEGFQSDGVYQWDSFQNGSGYVLGLAAGYAPVWWFEGSLAVGIAGGHKMLSTGYDGGATGGYNELELDAISAMIGLLEPKGRVYVNPIGPAKPYGLAAFTLRFFDGYDVPNLDGVAFPTRPGGTGLGPTVGAGIAIDAAGSMGGFLEVPWTFLLTPPAYYAPDADVDAPVRYAAVRQMLRLQAGIQARF